jgi:hypothetical protein
MITTKKQYRVYIVNKLASYFGVRKEVLNKEVNIEEDELLTFATLQDEHYFNDELYVTHLDHFKLLDILNGKKFSKTVIFDEFHNGKARTSDVNSSYKMVIHMVGLYWIIYEAEIYAGNGGMFVRLKEGDNTGYVMEQFEDYLKVNYKVNKED